MTGAEQPRDEGSMDEHALEAVLNRLLGGAVAGVLKAAIMHKVRQEGTADPERLLQEIENLNPWLGELLRASVTGVPDTGLPGGRTQRSTTARKGEK